ncbi:MAG: penicillin-binding protein 1C [Endomicrobium sp.]|jgi:penicillin-binding protein 1C|nr:penicillin-binding protein 1C [Endomicrobium sp.]
MSKNNKKIILTIKRAAVVLPGVLFLLLIIRIFPRQNILSQYSFSQAVFDRNDKLLRLTTSQDEKYRLFVPLSKMPESLKKGTLLYEDKYFYFHPGVNPVSLLKGFWISIIKKQRPVGASTITMQLARMIYGIDSACVSGKIKQIFAAFWLEMRYGKNDILEAYLNIAPYGYNIEGAAAAALIYFSAKAENLTILESFTLCVIPQNPNLRKLSDSTTRKRMENARRIVFEKWIKKYPQDADKKNYFDMPLQIKKPSNLPFEAPHFVNKILDLNDDFVISTTLDLNIQRLVEERMKYYIERNESKGINNACAIVLNYKSMDICAYIGSADFFDDTIQGQVNGCAAYRSPGSTLKPFIYAIALDKGIIHPLTLLKDTPKHYGIHSPENSDRDFLGPVFAKDALTQSRNIPAIELLFKINPDSFLSLLQKTGVKNLKDSQYYGSSFAIGGFEISSEKIAQLYAMFANGGILKDLRFDKYEKVQEENVLSPEAAFLTLMMLKDNKRPENKIRAAQRVGDFEVYWKTGTSYAFRDAWTAGVFGDYVLVVWIGKFDNEGNQTFTARDSATPLFFEIIKSVSGEKKEISGSKMRGDNLNITKVEVCSVSGDLPSQYCRQTTETYFIPAKSPIKICDVHRPVYIDKKTGLRAAYYDPEKTNIAVYEFWNSEIMSIFTMAGISHRTPPRYLPDLEIGKVADYGNPPQILLPTTNITYAFRAENFENETIPFKADADSDAKNIFWFLNDKYIGQSKPGTVLSAKTESGAYTVRAVDDLGRASTSKLNVEIIGK